MSAVPSLSAALTEDHTVAQIGVTFPIQRRPLHDEATERIRDLIVEGRLAAGEWINESELCQQLQSHERRCAKR